jgi:hypothetical protein
MGTSLPLEVEENDMENNKLEKFLETLYDHMRNCPQRPRRAAPYSGAWRISWWPSSPRTTGRSPLSSGSCPKKTGLVRDV